MSLSRLELAGFKSFMSPVTFHFREGITAILGPNGCGKTNIVDAVRWVLGEQSARQLRGSKMENVIFNGTQVYKPMGYAVVNLTVNNERGIFPLDYSEINITRKVYRSGISEYFINKAPCRLKDIKELFADTGTGSHSYSIIEQEMIDYVLSDSHGERRVMFEEAAGIVKYRLRRDEAERKLKLTELDLVRIEDITEELGKQVRSLRYQVGKAKRYSTIKDRIRSWELYQLRGSLRHLLEERRAAESELSEVIDLTQREDLSLGEAEKRVEEEKMRIIDLEKRNTELQNGRYEVRRSIQTAEERVIQFTERRHEAEKRIRRAEHEIEEAKIRLDRIAERIESVTVECEAIYSGINAQEDSVHTLVEESEKVSGTIDGLKARLLELKQSQLNFLQNQTRIRSSMEHYESVLAELGSRAADTRERVLMLEGETAKLASEKGERDTEVKALQDRLQCVELECEGIKGTVRDVEDSLFERAGLLSGKITELARLRSRYDLLIRMREELEGFPAGARHILKKGDLRVRGPLAELLSVEDGFQPALEAVLGGMLDGIVVDSLPSAIDLLRELTNENLGRVRFFVEDSAAIDRADLGAELPGCLGKLSSRIHVDDTIRTVVENLLGDTYIFESSEDVLNFMSSEFGNGLSAVTLSGIYFCRGKGVYFSGSTGGEISLLGRSEEIDRIEGSISVLEDEKSRLEGECEGIRGDREALQGRVKKLEEEISGLREELSGRRDELREVERDHITKKEKCALLMKTFDDIESSRMGVLSKLEETRLTLQLQQEGEEVSEAVGLETELVSLGEKREGIEAALTAKRLELASLQGTLEKNRTELSGLKEMEEQFQGIIGQRSDEIDSSMGESAELDEGKEQERGVVLELLERERSYQKDLDELIGLLEEKRSEIAIMEKDLKNRQAKREGILNRENKVRVILSSLETKMRDLVDRGKEIYGDDLSCYLDGREIPDEGDEGSVTSEMLDRERKKLESLGPVNLAAVEEYEEKRTRLDFLLAQKDDLVGAKEELSEAIRKINKRARKRFLETFEVVSGHFAETFRVLFEGGDAALSLSNGSDPLEADIVITARPQGKRFQDISLLSGGERALTALALLFALYKSKPSPFCIFDEVDAPLDDANIRRFIRMIKKFQQDTQFIIITHNKRTMEVADTLYGITMEQRGVSSVVSVDMTDVDGVLRDLESDKGTLVETPISSN